MVVLDGKAVSATYIEKLKKAYAKIRLNDSIPHLAIICMGHSAQSAIYIKAKMKMCEDVGFRSTYKKLTKNISQEDVRKVINDFNQDKEITGIILQLPLPSHLNEHELVECIHAAKDVDGFTPQNMGNIALHRKGLTPATPLGIMMLLAHYHISTIGKHVVILGRSRIVGKPLSIMLSANHQLGNATVTLCHSKTKNLTSFTKQADILIVAVGIPRFLTSPMLTKGTTVIDVGIHNIADAATGQTAIVGDVNYESVAPYCYAVSPVPGGVGKMTVAALMYNLLEAFALQHNINYQSPFSYA